MSWDADPCGGKSGPAPSARRGRSADSEATPAGFENHRGSASLGETGSESNDSEKLGGASQRLADATGSKVARLVRVARNALRNGDLHRAAEVLEQIEELVGARFGGGAEEA
jgi:hypothetical protein